jgi:hypothetical protein
MNKAWALRGPAAPPFCCQRLSLALVSVVEQRVSCAPVALGAKRGLSMSDASGAGVPPRRELRIDRVLGRSFSLLGNRLLRYFLLSALPGLPSLVLAVSPQLLPPWVNPATWSDGLQTGALDSSTMLVLALGLLALGILMLVVFTVVYVAMIYGVFQDMREHPFNLTEGLGRGLGRFWPLIGLWICAGLGTMVGLLLLIVPGVILIVMWWTAAPACVLERLGPIRSLERSGDLTRGNRWRLLAIIVSIAIVSSFADSIIVAVPTALNLPIVAAVLSYIWNTLSTAYHLIATVVAYHELRFAREGVDASSIASVFD